MADDSSARAATVLPASGLLQAGLVLAGMGYWDGQAALALAAGLAAWLIWTRRRTVGRWLRLERELTARVTVTDPHGFHMRRCADLVQVARAHVTYNIHVRHHSGGGKTWASARSLMGLMSLGVRGPLKDQAPPVVEVRIHGLRPGRVLRQIRKVLEKQPEKYLSVYELAELAEKTGGALVVRKPAPKQAGHTRQIAEALARVAAWLKAGLRPSNCQNPGKSDKP